MSKLFPATLLTILAVVTISPLLVVAQTDLGGTTWQLVKFQSSDGTTLTPDDKSKYTITFGTDGRVSARMDCNRGSGSWRSMGRNQLRFGRMAMTRAMCPPGSLHDRIVRDWSSVRSYVIRDGHLFLSLMADGGIYGYEPVDSLPSPATPGTLFGKQWKLTEVAGSAVKTSPAHIEFDRAANRFSGNGGCNLIAGNFQVNGTSIRFSEAVSTKRACIDREVQQIETDFFAALEQANRFEIERNVLKLYAGEREVLTFQTDATDTNDPAPTRVTGTVSYRQRIALRPRAVVEVKLLDVSRAGGRSVTIAEQKIEARGQQVPIAFDLPYDASRINPRGRYSVRVRILEGNRLRFTSTNAYQVITGGNPNTVNVMVVPVRR